MSNIYFTLFAVGVFLTWLTTPAVISVAYRFRVYGHAHGGRRQESIPRLGGLAVFLALVLAGFFLNFVINYAHEPIVIPWHILMSLLLPASLVLLLGAYDDIAGATPGQKLLVEFLAASFAWFLGIRVHAVPVLGFPIHSEVLSFLVTVLWILTVTNALNLIDGLDGLAVGIAFFVALAIFVVAFIEGNTPTCLLSIALAGSLLGFLRFNSAPAKIFLGDTGSLFLGFLLGSLAVFASAKSSTLVALAVPYLAFGVPVLDTSLSVVRRFLSGRPVFGADCNHIHHKLMESNSSPQRAVWALYGLAAMFSIGSLLILVCTHNVFLLLIALCGVTGWFLTTQVQYEELIELYAYLTRSVRSHRRAMANRILIRKASQQLDRSSGVEESWELLTGILKDLGFDGIRCQLGLWPGNSAPILPAWQRLGNMHPDHLWSTSIPLRAGNLKLGTLQLQRSLGKNYMPFQITSLLESLIPPFELRLKLAYECKAANLEAEFDRADQRESGRKVSKRVILYGAGRAGVLLLRELRRRGEAEVIGFIDDDPNKIGTKVAGVDVLCGGGSMGKAVLQSCADEVIISMATASFHTLMQILARCKQVPVSAKIIPTLREITSGLASISSVRDAQIEELLGRDNIRAPEFSPEVRKTYEGKRILVTGAGGSVGSELVRQLLLFNPLIVGVLDKDENSIQQLQEELKFSYPKAPICPYIADIRHRERLLAVFTDLRPQIVFHAAAHKHAPLLERHPSEVVLNNVLGTNTLLQTASEKAVERFLFISADEAVNPASVMDATKRVGEMLVQLSANGGPMRAACVRFGNVMDNRGGAVPRLQRQIAEGGPITVTHQDVVRFSVTTPEAVQLVLSAGSIANHGEVFVLDMGSPNKLLALASEMVALSGLQAGKEIRISVNGLRPSEKTPESMVCVAEPTRPTRFEKVSLVIPGIVDQGAFLRGFSLLARAARQNDSDAIYESFAKMGLVFHPSVAACEATPREPSVRTSGPSLRPTPATLPQ